MFFEVSEKQLKNEIGFNLIIENDDGSCDHTANCFLTLDKILSGNPTKSEEVYYAEDLKKEVSYVSNKFSMQGVLESLFENDEQCFDSQSKKTVLHFDAWFLGDVDKEKISHQTRKEAKDESAEIKTLEKIFRANVSLAFEKYSSYPFSERNFFDLRGKDSYLSEHILSYFIAPIVLTEQQRGTLQTLPSIAHFVRCYPMSYVDNILSSDYMIKNRKGGVLCHSILMANLMAGLMQDKGGSEGLGSVFVCIGALKESHLKHTWVMVIKNSTVCFYDPIVASNTTLKGRVNDVTRLNSYLGNSPEETNSEKSNKNIRGIIKGYGKEKGEMEKVILKCQNETIIEYDDQEDFDENNTISNNTMSILNKSRTAEEVKQKIINNKLVDQKIIKKPSTDSSSQHFISSEKDSIELDIEEEKNLKKIPNEFDDETPLNIPYETVDVIFNDKNIFANSQHHSPDKIYYDLYDKTKWIAFYDRPVQRENSSWNYNFGPSYSKKIISSMTTKLQREVKVEIAVSRKNLNMYTKFKKMKEQIVLQLENYLDILEKRALGVYEQGEFEEALEEFSSRVKEYMPQFFKMEMNDLFFNSFDLVSIRKDVREKLEGIWNDRRKKIIFGSSAKVYGYINHTISVRVAVAKFYKIPLEDVKSEREEMEYEEKEELLESKEEE